jgi:hypothetical protein
MEFRGKENHNMNLKLASVLPEEFSPKAGERHVPFELAKSRDFIFKNCKVALKKLNEGVSLYRGEKNIIDPVYIVDPRHRQRISKDTSNIYNLYMDTSPHWKDYPSRSFSIMFGSEYVASSYSSRAPLHIILPIGDPVVAVSSKTDFLDCDIEYNYHKADFHRTIQCDVQRWGRAIEDLLVNIGNMYLSKEKDASVFSRAVDKMMERLETNVRNDDGYVPDDYSIPENNLYNILKNVILYGREEPKYIFYEVMTPQILGVRKMNLSALSKITTESWTEGKCVVIREDYYHKIFKKEIGSKQLPDLEKYNA